MNLAHTIRLFVVRFVFLCLSYYCTFVHTLVLSEVAGRQPVRIAVVCDAFCILLLYFCTYLCFLQGHRPPAIAH